MSLTESSMMKLGTTAPDFSLLSTEGNTLSLSGFEGKPVLVVIFMCNHCPYVIHIADALAARAKEFMARGVAFVGINSNDPQAYPADSYENMKREKQLRNYPFPYLLDDTQKVAKAYQAACTPDLYVFGAARELVYRGQFDDTRPNRISSGNYDSGVNPASGNTLAVVLEAVLAGEPVPEKQYPSMGCNIKWKT